MKSNVAIAFCFILTLLTGCQYEQSSQSTVDAQSDSQSQASSAFSTIKVVNQVVEASCGQCQFGLTGDGCDLSVRIDGETYYVDGSSIDDHGDAHADIGLCNCVRQAKVSGEIKDGRFVATSFEVLPQDQPAKDYQGN